MSRRLIVEFVKMSGAGNDFIVIDNRFYNFSAEECAAIAPRICARREGIGADGILLLAEPAGERTHFRMIYYNADGTEGTMCGNGARCLARYAVNSGMPHGELHFNTASGTHVATVPENPEKPVRISMGRPDHWRSPQRLAGLIPDEISGVHFLWTGTEHVVCFVADVAGTPVTEWGRAIRQDESLVPTGANVNFVEVHGPGRISVRTYEKGVEAETLACGTGAVASALTARYLGHLQVPSVEVKMLGGVLHVGTEPYLFLEGPATTVYRGSFEW